MTVAQTSIEAFRNVQPKLGNQQLLVYRCLSRHPNGLNNKEIAEALGWDINRVTPRCKELRERGIVEFFEYRPCSFTGKNTMVWVCAFHRRKNS